MSVKGKMLYHQIVIDCEGRKLILQVLFCWLNLEKCNLEVVLIATRNKWALRKDSASLCIVLE